MSVLVYVVDGENGGDEICGRPMSVSKEGRGPSLLMARIINETYQHITL